MDLNKQEVEIMQKNYNDLLLTYHSKDYEKLLLDSISFCKKYPKNIYGFNVLALAYKNVGNYEKSIDLFEKMMATNPLETSIYTNAGNTYHAIGRMTKSFECHRKALEIDPNCIGSMNGCGLALADGGKEDEAIEYYKKIPEIDAKETSAYYNIGNILRNKKDYQQAAEYYGKHQTKISKAQELECLYRLEDLHKFDKRLSEFEAKFGFTPLVATMSTHASIKYSRDDNYLFAPDAFNLIEKNNLIDDKIIDQVFINNFLKEFNELSLSKKTQSLINNGFQSSGNLFLYQKETIQKLKKIILESINSYRNKYSESNYKIFSEWPKKFDIYAWVISISNQGSLLAHMHKEGWLSGSFYLNIPPKEEDSLEGDIRFSLEGGAYEGGGKEYPEKIVNLKTGDIVMFPSSLFHNTIPFSSPKNRITLAFDVRPLDIDIIK